MEAVARLGKNLKDRIVPPGGSGAAQTFLPFQYIGIKTQKDLSLWRKWKRPNEINDSVMFTTERIKFFLEYTMTLKDSETSGIFEDPEQCLLMAQWLKRFRLNQVIELNELYDRYLTLIQRGEAFDSVAETLRARKEITIANRSVEAHTRGVRINRIEVSRTGQYIAECADDGLLNLFSPENLMPVGEIRAEPQEDGSRAKFYSADFSIDGRLIATASNDGKACVWDTHTGDRRMCFSHPDAIADVSLSPDAKKLAVACDDFLIYIWSLSTQKILSKLKLHTGMVRSVNFSSDGKYIVSSGQDQTSVLWDARKKVAVWAWGLHGGRLYDAIVIGAHRAVATACTDNFVRVFCMDTGKLLASSKHHWDWVNSMCVSRDGTKILTASRDKTARIWKWKDNDQALCIHESRQVLRAARFSHDEKWIITGGYDGVISIWESSL